MPTKFSSQFLLLSDRLQQIKDELASETIAAVDRKHLERQLVVTERALKRAFEEENERRRKESASPPRQDAVPERYKKL